MLETRESGVDTNVSDIQPILLFFAQKKSDKGHKLHFKFSNIRAERGTWPQLTKRPNRFQRETNGGTP